MPGDIGENVTDPRTIAATRNSGKPDLIGERMLWANRLWFLNPNERTVLVAVAYSDGPGGAYPSAETLARQTGISRTAVWKALTGLIDRGILSRKRHQRSNFYTVDYDFTVPTTRTVNRNLHRPGDREFHRSDDRDAHRSDDRDGNRKNRTEQGRGSRQAPPARSPAIPDPLPKEESAREGGGRVDGRSGRMALARPPPRRVNLETPKPLPRPKRLGRHADLKSGEASNRLCLAETRPSQRRLERPMTDPKPRTPRRAPLYGDTSDTARLYWLHKALTEYEIQANGNHAASQIMEHAKERIPAIRAEIERLEGPPLRVIDGGAR